MFFLFAGSLFAVESGEPLFVLTGASYRPLGEKESFDVLAVTNRQTWLALGDDADERIVSEVLSCAEKVYTSSGKTALAVYVPKDFFPPLLQREFDVSFERTKMKFAERSFPGDDDRLFFWSVFMDMPVFRELGNRLRDRSFTIWRDEWRDYPNIVASTWEDVIPEVINLEDCGLMLLVSRTVVPPSLPEYRLTNGVAKVSARVLPVPSGEPNFVPFSCSYDLKTVVGVSTRSVRRVHSSGERHYLYSDLSSCFSRIPYPEYFEQTPYRGVLSGNGKVYGFTARRKEPSALRKKLYLWADGHFGTSLASSGARIRLPQRAYAFADGKVTPLKLQGKNIAVSFGGYSCDGKICACFRAGEPYTGMNLALVEDGYAEDVDLTDISPSTVAASCQFVSSNGLVVAGTAYDTSSQHTLVFRAEKGHPSKSISLPVGQIRHEGLTAMSASGEVFAGTVSCLSLVQSLNWIYQGGIHERLATERKDILSLNVHCISNDGEVAGGLARFTNGDTESFVIKNKALVFINDGLPADLRVLGVVGMLDDGSRLLCHGFLRGIGKCGVVVDIDW